VLGGSGNGGANAGSGVGGVAGTAGGVSAGGVSAGGVSAGGGGSSGSGQNGGAGGGGAPGCSGEPDATCPCIKVAPDGDDALAAQSGGALSFQSIQAGVDFADQHRDIARSVCVAQGAECGTIPANGFSTADLRMRDGISVYGNYESSSWTRCTAGYPVIWPVNVAGVRFGADVQSRTRLDGFLIIFPQTSSTTTAITIAGARGVELNKVRIVLPVGTPQVAGLTAVDVSGGADAWLNVSMSQPQTTGTTYTAYGIRVADSRVTIDGSAMSLPPSYDAVGLWLTNAPGSIITASQFTAPGTALKVRNGGSSLVVDGLTLSAGTPGDYWKGKFGIDVEDTAQISARGTTVYSNGIGIRVARGRLDFDGTVTVRGDYSMETSGVVLEDAPGSVVRGTLQVDGDVVRGVRVSGDARDVEIGGSITVRNDQRATGVEFAECGTGTPLVAHAVITGSALPDGPSGTLVGIQAADCAARLVSNQIRLDPSPLDHAQEITGIRCTTSLGNSARCTVSDNDIAAGFPGPPRTPIFPNFSVTSVGIDCDCSAVTGNHVVGLLAMGQGAAQYRGGGAIVRGSPLISGNFIESGCSGDGAGLTAAGRIENNVILGPNCGGLTQDGTAHGVGLALSGDAVVHSNTIFGGAPSSPPPGSPPDPGSPPCESTGLATGSGQIVLRNNIIGAGACATAQAVLQSADVAPLAIEHDDLTSPTGVLYRQGTTALTTVAEVNALSGVAASGNFSADPLLDSSFRLSEGSLCIDAGTTSGAPARDRDGDPRDSAPDVGADERTACDTNHGGCATESVCIPLENGTTCATCPPGYTDIDGNGCVDRDECAEGTDDCTADSTCVNTSGAFTCACTAGYDYRDDPLEHGCFDVDECATANGGCGGAICTNSQGGYACSPCPPGYTGATLGCVDVDECLTQNGGCDPLTVCTNFTGGRSCGPCPDHYAGTGESGCLFESCEGITCQNGGSCVPDGEGARCDCPTGINGAHCEIVFTALKGTTDGVCGLRSDGKITCWGTQELIDDPPVGTFVSYDAGTNQVCAMDGAGAVQCFGSSQNGVMDIPALPFASISVGSAGACGVLDDGSAQCWGTITDLMPPPSGAFSSLSLGAFHGCGVRSDQTLACWPYWDDLTDLNHGQFSPPGGTFLAVRSDIFGSCGLRTDGTLACWGTDDDGKPVVPPSGTFTTFDFGNYYGCAIDGAGALQCWGTPPGATPATPPAGPFIDIATAGFRPCALRADHTVACWGIFAGGVPIPTGEP